MVLAEDLAARCAIAIDNSRLMQDAKNARAQAEEANQAKMRYLSTMSHELRTPLNAIAGYAELLEDGVPDPLTEAQHTNVRRIQANERLLLELVESVLSYAKLDAGHTKFDLEDVPLGGVIAEVERTISESLKRIFEPFVQLDDGLSREVAVGQAWDSPLVVSWPSGWAVPYPWKVPLVRARRSR